MWCVILFGDFPTEVTGPFKTRESAYDWLKFNYGAGDGVVIRFRLAS